MQRRPAEVGDRLSAIETPALVVQLDVLERNLDRMANATKGIRLRPHGKAHKCPDIARLQMARGAVGVCCQKTDEAIAFVEGGILDVLVTNEVVAPSKIQRLATLALDATVGVLVDDETRVAALSAAAVAAQSTLDVYVEIDIGAHRCGIAPGEGALRIAQAVAGAPQLRFRGLHAYHGPAQHLRAPDERRAAIANAAMLVKSTRAMIEDAGIACPVVTGAGTGTWRHEIASGVWTELQPGTYPFMDGDYNRNELGNGDVAFEQSLFVLAGVMSMPTADRAIVDAGLKAFAFDSGLPQVWGRKGVSYVKATDEHGVLASEAGNEATLAINDSVWLVPGHCDPTFNLYDWIVGLRDDRVEAIWPISARGALA